MQVLKLALVGIQDAAQLVAKLERNPVKDRLTALVLIDDCFEAADGAGEAAEGQRLVDVGGKRFIGVKVVFPLAVIGVDLDRLCFCLVCLISRCRGRGEGLGAGQGCHGVGVGAGSGRGGKLACDRGGSTRLWQRGTGAATHFSCPVIGQKNYDIISYHMIS